MLTSALAVRIRRLIPLLSSPHDGEAIATRNAIGRELTAGGSDWHALAASIVGADRSSTAPPPCYREPPSFGDLARACRDLDQGRLRQRARDFVMAMCRLGFAQQPPAWQCAKLRDIYWKLSRRAAA